MNKSAPVIVGLSTRVPGARGNAEMWDVLVNGRCTISTVDTRLFDPVRYFDPQKTRRGKTYSIAAGQLENLYHFDAGFFGITPREANQMDAQQTLMLQSVWEAVADAGLNIENLSGDRTGVFVGASLVEGLSLAYYDTARGDSTFILGNTLSIIANRVSSVFDFRGPSLVVDTACASSFYALDLAVGALERGEIDTAIVGGVHVARTPGGYVAFSQARMMSATGLCRAFDAAADGYVRSEASIVVVLQRPEIANRMGARKRARILASGVNTDGATSRITVPSMRQQTALLDRVVTASDIDPDDFAFFEAHGTGTPVGDPIEAGSIGASVATLRREPLLIGSSKTNFGHAEPASGLVALAKTLLAMEHGVLPASLHCASLNPAIDFDRLNLVVNRQARELDRDAPLIAGINSFGFGGANASVVVTSDVATTPPRAVPSPHGRWLLVSAASEWSLQELAKRWAARLDRADGGQRADLAAAAGHQPFLAHRLAVRMDRDTGAALRGAVDDRVLRAHATLHKPRTVFAFAGNGTQVVGMGRSEYATSPRFRKHFDEVAEEFGRVCDVDLIACLHDDDLMEKLLDPIVAQSILFAYQVALARSLQDAGMVVDAVIGHSVGEIAALHVAGVFDLADAVHIIVSRSRAFSTLRGTGTMAAIAAAAADVERAIRGLDTPDLVIAAVNSPRSVTVSGPAADISRLRRVQVAGRRLAMVPLKVEIPYHSPAVDVLRDRFMADLTRVTFCPARIPVASSVMGRMLRTSECGVDYMWRNARDVVRFSDAVQALGDTGSVFLTELSPVASFAGNIRDLTRQDGIALEHFVPALYEDAPNDDFTTVIARAWVRGASIDVSKMVGPSPATPPVLPEYPWDERDYFSELSPDGLDAWGEQSARGFAGLRAERAAPVWMRDFTPTAPAWVADHVVGTTTILPATALVEMALSAGRELFSDVPILLANFDIVAPVVLVDDGVRMRTIVDEATGAITISQRPRLSDIPWGIVARGVLRVATMPLPTTKGVPPRTQAAAGDDLYRFLAGHGLPYGPAFRRVAQTRMSGRDAVWVDLVTPLPDAEWVLDPLAFDAALHGLGVLLRGGSFGDGRTLVPVRVGELHLWRQSVPHIAAAQVRLLRIRAHSVVADVTLFDPDGIEVARINAVEFAQIATDHTNAIPATRIIQRRICLRADGDPVRVPIGWTHPDKVAARFGFSPTVPEQNALERALDSVRPDLVGDLEPVISLQPQIANDLRAMMCVVDGQSSLQDRQQGMAHRLIWRQAEPMLTTLSQRWRKGQRFNLLIHGLPDPAVVRRLSALSNGPDRIFIAGSEAYLLPHDLRALAIDVVPEGAVDVILDVAEGVFDIGRLASGGIYLRLDVPAVAISDAAMEGVAYWRGDADLPIRLRMMRKVGRAVGMPVDTTVTVLDGSDPLPAWAGDLVAVGACRMIVCAPSPDDDPVAVLARMLDRIRHAGAGGDLVVSLFAIADHPAHNQIAAGLASAMRTVTNEWPQTQCGLIVAETKPDTGWGHLVQMALRNGTVFVTDAGLQTYSFMAVPAPDIGGPMRLVQDKPGRFDDLRWEHMKLRVPDAGQVEISVRNTGVNFRDVMSARGILPERMLDAGATGAALGMECSGVVTRVGAGCSIAVGAPVMALAPAAFANVVCVAEHAVAPIPQGMTFAEAAAIPVAFMTAWHGLVNVARLRSGDTVLIHGAAGGVGLAAIQIALWIGARVLATAGTAHKRALAHAFGADEVFDSRSLVFADAVRSATQGRGVNVVLNSLSGAGMQRSVECLAPFGTFVELGKRDYLEGTALDLRPFLHNLSYHGVDLDEYVAHYPEQAGRDMAQIVDALAQGHLRPLPVVGFEAADVGGAFAHMLAARHVGKIVVTPPHVARRKRAVPLRGGWVLVGGTGGLGLVVARMLLAQGADAVHLVSRSGEMGLENLREYGWMRDDNRVVFHAVDATDRVALAQVLDRVDALTGVIDLAMVLRDRMLDDLDPHEAVQVMTAKLGVARALDHVLRARAQQPRHVVFFSSIASILGNIGQAAYGASNAAVEELVAKRRADGLSALCIGWGPISDAGYLLRDTVVAAQLSRQRGIRLLTSREFVDHLQSALLYNHTYNHTYASVKYDYLLPHLRVLAQPTFAPLVGTSITPYVAENALGDMLRVMPWADALALARTELAQMLAGIVHQPVEQFDMNRPLTSHGLDSLMAMEMRLEIERRFGCAMPAAGIGREVTAARLAVLILGTLRDATDEQEKA